MLDEPLGALDRSLRERLMNDLRTILNRVGVTAIYVTPDLMEAFAVSDRIAVMNQGRIEQLAAPEEVYNHPASPFVARFLGFLNVISGVVAAHDKVQTELGELHVARSLPAENTAVTILVRPEAAQLIESGEGLVLNEFFVEVTAVSFRGKYYQVWTVVNDMALVFEMQDAPGSIGGHVRLALDPYAVEILAA